MEVYNAQGAQQQRQMQHQGTSQSSEYRSEIRAQIVDIRRDSMIIRSPNGTMITGRLAADASPIDARIGETHTFTVSRGEGGEVILEMHSKSHDVRQTSAIKDALTSLGLTANADNTRIALTLFENQIPITRENMMKMIQGARIMGADALERVLFFLENELPIAPKLTAAFDTLLAGQFKINEQLQGVADGLKNLGIDGQKLADILLRGEAALTQSELVAKLAQTTAPKAGAVVTTDQTAALLLNTFANNNLQQNSVTRLAQSLTEMNPSASEQITKAAQARTDYTQVVAENRGQLGMWLSSNLRGDATDMQRFSQLLQELMPSTDSAARELAQTQQGIRLAFATIFEGDTAQLARVLESMGMRAESRIVLPEAAEASAGKQADTAGQVTGKDATDTLAQRLSYLPEGNVKLADFMERYLHDTRANFELARQVLIRSGASGSAAGTQLLAQLSAICDNMEFVANLRNSFYAQIPVMLGDNSATAELYVFRDRSKRNQAGSHASALVAIDTMSLGRFEAYVVKRGKTLSCQFRLENEEVREHVSTHLEELREALAALDYRLDAISYRESGESFTLMNKEPQLEQQDSISASEFRRTSFDVRV